MQHHNESAGDHASRNASPVTSWSREHWALATLLATLAVFTISIVPGLANATREPVVAHNTFELELPPISLDPTEGDTHDMGEPDWQQVAVAPGQTFGQLFGQLGLSTRDMYRLLEHPGAEQALTRIRAGQQFEFDIPNPGELRAVRFERGDEIVQLALTEGGVEESVTERQVQRRVMMASGEVRSSLFEAGERAGIANSTLFAMANVLENSIDFSRDIRTGDRFHVIYEEIWRDGERLRDGGVVAASFTNRGKDHVALRYVHADGKVEYYDQDGRPVRGSFLRMPIEFSRISSRFNPNRRHPIYGTVRAHQGVDFAAATGTPIRTAGNGRITFAGWQGGYGRTVIVDHGRGITTLYAHMSRLGNYRVGQRVTQGNVIGYVGATGTATGPHLHYEFRVNGAHRDPLTVTLPKPEPLPANELARFRAQTAPALAQIQLIDGRRLALAE